MTDMECTERSMNLCERERFFFDTVNGTTYHVLMQYYPFKRVDLSLLVAPSVVNDQCIDALPIAISSTVYGDLTFATSDYFGVANACMDGARPYNPGIWYSFVGTGERLVVRECQLFTSLYIYTGGSSLLRRMERHIMFWCIH